MQRVEGQCCSNQAQFVPTKEIRNKDVRGQAVTPTNSAPASAFEPDRQPPKPLEQGRQRFVRQRQEKAAAQRRANSLESEYVTPAQQRDVGNIQPRHTPTLSVQEGKRSAANAVRETVSSSKRQIKEVRTGTKAVGRASRQTVKAADSSKQVAQAGGRSARTVQHAAQAAVQARQRAVQVAGAARRTAATVDRPVVKAAASALRGAVSAIRSMIAPLAAGGGAVISVVLVLCLVGALLMSPLGIFFSGEDHGGQTMSSVVREINQEYEARVEALKTGTTHDELSLSGSRATWPEILAVYAVKTVTDPTNGQEVITMDDAKKELLKQVFWNMNELSSFTSTVPGEGDDEEDTTTLHITVTAKTANEIADIYGFNEAAEKAFRDNILIDRFKNHPLDDTVHFHVIHAGDRIQSEGWEIIAVPADHDKLEECLIYICKKDGKTMLYGHDTGCDLSHEAWELLKSEKYDLVSLDATLGTRTIGRYHMGLPEVETVFRALTEYGCVDQHTVKVINHFGHNGGMTHDQLYAWGAERGILASYDGMELEF